MAEIPMKPTMMPVACITCGRLCPPGTSRCKDHGGQAWAGKPRNRQAEYNNRGYKANRAKILEGHPPCHWGFRGCTGKATTADHLIALAEGGPSDLANLVPACGRCNAFRGASLGGRVTKARRRKEGGSNVRPIR